MSKQKHFVQPTVAPGMEDDDLNREASSAEKANSDTTIVTTLSFDEHDNGSQESTNS